MNKVNETTTIKGVHTFRTYDMTSERAQAIETALEQLFANRPNIAPEAYKFAYDGLVGELKQFMTKERVVLNLVATVGRSVLAQRLANTLTYTGVINYGVLGSSSTAVNNADTQLGTEVFRKVVASASYTTNVAFIDFFYSKADTNGTYQEFGTFIDGGAGANTGQLFTHALTGGWVKTSSESMTVSCQYTFN